MDSTIEDLSEDQYPFPKMKSPCTIMISGVSGSGKSTLVHKLLVNRDAMFESKVYKVLYCMQVDQPLYDQMRTSVSGIKFRRGIPSEEDLLQFTDGTKHCILVLDDLMEEVVRSVDVQSLFTKLSHHLCISVIFISQNMYAQGKCSRNISMNVHYFFVLCNPRDVGQINMLAKQTGLGEELKKSYRDCVLRKTYGYMFISLHPADVAKYAYSGNPRLEAVIRTNIFPNEQMISYTS